MFHNRHVRALVALLVLCCPGGCSTLRKQKNYDALIEPVSYKDPEPEHTVVKKSKELTWRSMEVVGLVGLLLGWAAFETITDTDD